MRRFRRLLLVAGAALLASAGTRAGAADSKETAPLSRDALDRRVHTALFKVLSDGADLFNDGKRNEAAFYFEGAAAALAALLDHRPELQAALRDGLADAQTLAPTQRAKALHGLLWNAYERTTAMLPKPGKGTTLWARLGGEEGVTRVVDDFVDRCLKNEKANFTRGRKYLQTPEKIKELKHSMFLLASHLAKGPHKWEGPTMQKVHDGMGITDAEFDAVRIELRFTLLDHNATPEDIALILAAVESTRGDIVARPRGEETTTTTPLKDASLLGRLGGKERVEKMIGTLVDRLVKDERVNFSRGGKYPMTEEKLKQLKQQFFDLAVATSKGKGAYKGRSMLDAHQGMGITDAEYDAFLDVLTQVLREYNVGAVEILLLRELVENKREDIVEKPRKASDLPREAPRKAEAPGQSRAPGGDSPFPPVNRRAAESFLPSVMWPFIPVSVRLALIPVQLAGKLAAVFSTGPAVRP
jgi:hemoglobin